MHSSTAIAKILSNILTFLFIKVKHTYTKKSVRYDGVIVSNGTQCSIINSWNRLKHKTCGQSTIEQTPNARDGYLIAFVAGLLTYSSSPRLPGILCPVACCGYFLSELTAAGTVPDFHRIPF
jgi:hypothetical protein